jgi:hypothetical protein
VRLGVGREGSARRKKRESWTRESAGDGQRSLVRHWRRPSLGRGQVYNKRGKCKLKLCPERMGPNQWRCNEPTNNGHTVSASNAVQKKTFADTRFEKIEARGAPGAINDGSFHPARLNTMDAIVAALPLVTGYASTIGRPPPRTTTAAVPPGIVFGSVWPVLYILTGAAWLTTRCTEPFSVVVDATFAALTLALASWTPLYARGGAKAANYAVLVALALALAATLLASRRSELAAVGLTPLVAWLTFAMGLGIGEANAPAAVRGLRGGLLRRG